MSEAFKRRAKKKAKKGRRILVAAMAAAMAFGNIGYVHAAGVDDVFDEHYYADQYPDLKAAFGYSRSALLKHFMKFGLAEGRVMNEMIDIVKYRAIYKDLQAAFGDDWDKYIEHYLAHGAFEKRDNGTDFDPVDYLNRYNELQATFGSDLLSAYKHYKEYGKQEGRDGRSENVIVAERRAAEYQAALESQAETSEPSEPSAEYSEPEDTWEPEPEAPPEEPSRPSETPSEPSGPSEPEKGSFEIQSVEVVGTGRIRVTLNQKTEQPLTLEAFSIICNSGGSDMTGQCPPMITRFMIWRLLTTGIRNTIYRSPLPMAQPSQRSLSTGQIVHRSQASTLPAQAPVKPGLLTIQMNQDISIIF